MTVDADRWDPLAGFDLLPQGEDTVFKVGTELLRAGGPAVEAAVEAGFPAGTELKYEGGAWVVVLPYAEDDEQPAARPGITVDLRPAPGYEWVEHEGRPVLRLLDEAGAAARPAFHPPGGRAGWRWRPAGDLGWVLIPPPEAAQPPATPPAAPPPARLAPAPAPPAPPPRAPAAPPSPPGPAPVRAPATEPAAPARRGRLLDVVGIVLIALGIGLGGVLLLTRGGDDGAPADAAALAELLGVAPADLLAAVTPHEPGELPTSVAPPADPLARIVGTALVLVDLDEGDAGRLAESVAGSPTPGQQLVFVLELAGDAPAPGAGYRYALLDAAQPVVRVPEGDDGDGLGRLDLRRAYLYDPALAAVAAEPGDAATGAFAAHEGRYVMIGVPRDELVGGTVFGHAVVRPAGTGPVAYTLSPAYQFG